jgi:hypothetical protein
MTADQPKAAPSQSARVAPRSGAESAAPFTVVDNAPAAFASRTASTNSAQDARNAASEPQKASPAPTVSTVATSCAPTHSSAPAPRSTTKAPREPSATTQPWRSQECVAGNDRLYAANGNGKGFSLDQDFADIAVSEITGTPGNLSGATTSRGDQVGSVWSGAG